MMAKRLFLGLFMMLATLTAMPAAAQTDYRFDLPEHRTFRPIPVIRAGLADDRSPRFGPVVMVLRHPAPPITDIAHRRFAGGMVDIYPLAPSGFHFGIGTRYFSRANFWVMAEEATLGRLPDVRPNRNVPGQRRQFNRFTPAATAGYDFTIARGLVAGFEGGALLGRAMPRGAHVLRLNEGGSRLDRGGGVNPVATVTMRYAF